MTDSPADRVAPEFRRETDLKELHRLIEKYPAEVARLIKRLEPTLEGYHTIRNDNTL